jgi:hypothetical protein
VLAVARSIGEHTGSSSTNRPCRSAPRTRSRPRLWRRLVSAN